MTKPADDGAIATFEGQFTGHLTSMTLSVSKSTDADPAPEGQQFAELVPKSREVGTASVRLPLPAQSNAVGRMNLSSAIRAPGASKPIELRWLALDAQHQPIFQRRFDLAPGDKWVRLDEPLHAWRWDNRRVGDWDEVKEIALVVSSPDVNRIDLDDVRFTGTESVEDRTKWLLHLAFGDRPIRQAQGDGLLVATDAVDGFTDADLKRQLEDIRRVRKFIRRVFGDAVRPTDELLAPSPLLIFKNADDYPAFVAALGRELRVTIEPPRSGGYTVQDISSSTYKPELGPRRPVYLHESVHGIVARDLRLITGHPLHNAMQEGIANYVQICVHPKSLDPAAFKRNFEKPIDAAGKSFFKPLNVLFANRISTDQYAQVAGVIAYLIEREPKLLQALTKGLADGETADNILTAQGKTWQQLEADWLAWGRERYERAGAADAPLFAIPIEFR